MLEPPPKKEGVVVVVLPNTRLRYIYFFPLSPLSPCLCRRVYVATPVSTSSRRDHPVSMSLAIFNNILFQGASEATADVSGFRKDAFDQDAFDQTVTANVKLVY